MKKALFALLLFFSMACFASPPGIAPDKEKNYTCTEQIEKTAGLEVTSNIVADVTIIATDQSQPSVAVSQAESTGTVYTAAAISSIANKWVINPERSNTGASTMKLKDEKITLITWEQNPLNKVPYSMAYWQGRA